MEEPATPRLAFTRPLRWTLAAALLVALATLGYREGYRRGYEPEELIQLPPSTLLVKTYPVADLVTPVEGHPSRNLPLDFDPLVDLIVSTVEHESWMENGAGDGEIQPFPTNQTLVISQTQRVHEQISDLLDQLRQMGRAVDAKQAISLFQSLAAYGKDGVVGTNDLGTLSFHGSKDPRTAVVECFAKTMQNISDVLGPPAFRGKRDEADFPAWSTAQELAWWPRGAGVAYIAIEPDADPRPQMILGWRPKEN